jgi:hypothetical protein
VVRRWQVNESQRAIARATGLARETVKKYLAAAISLGLSATGPPPTEAQLVALRRLGVVAVQPVQRVAPQLATLESYREQIATCLDQDHLLLTRIQELLDGQGVKVKYATLRRYVRQAGCGSNRVRRRAWHRRHQARTPRWISANSACSSIPLLADARWCTGC